MILGIQRQGLHMTISGSHRKSQTLFPCAWVFYRWQFLNTRHQFTCDPYTLGMLLTHFISRSSSYIIPNTNYSTLCSTDKSLTIQKTQAYDRLFRDFARGM